jgi:hypothetical protein
MSRANRDDLILGAMMIGIGGLRVGYALADHERFTPEPTLAAIMFVVGFLVVAGRR